MSNFVKPSSGAIRGTAIVSGDLPSLSAIYLSLSAGGTVAGATTFSASGTALTVSNNATVSGTLGVGVSPSTTQQITATIAQTDTATTAIRANNNPSFTTTGASTTNAITAAIAGTYTTNTNPSTVTGLRVQFTTTIASGITASGRWSASELDGARQGGTNDQGTLSNIYGIYSQFGNSSTNATAITSNAYGAYFKPLWSTGTVSAAYGVYIDSAGTGGTGPTSANYYGIYQNDANAQNLFNGNLTTNQAVATTGYDTSTATSGTITASANKPGLLITGAGGTTLTIKLPSSPIDGQQYWVASQGNFTTVTWQDSGGTAGNVIGGQASIGGTARGQRFVYSSSATKWFSIG